MKTLLAFLTLSFTIALICSPLYLVYVGIVFYNDYLWIKVLLVVVGFVLCKMVKPVSILTGKDFKIF